MVRIGIGDTAPAFVLKDQQGRAVAPVDFSEPLLVVYFFTRADTAGCTMEACHFRDSSGVLRDHGAAIVGISPDSVESHAAFAGKHQIPYPLLSDERDEAGTPKTCAAYGVWVQRALYGRKYMGVERSTFLLGADRRVLQVWERVRVPGHVERVVAEVRRIATGK